MSSQEPTVQLSPKLHSSLESRVARTEFESVDEYVRFVLEEVVDELDDTADDAATTADIQERLRALGYVET